MVFLENKLRQINEYSLYIRTYIMCAKDVYHTLMYTYVDIVHTFAYLYSVISLPLTIHAVHSTKLPHFMGEGTKSRENLPCPALKTAIRIFWLLQMWLGEALISGDLGTIHTHNSCTVHFVHNMYIVVQCMYCIVCTYLKKFTGYSLCTYVQASTYVPQRIRQIGTSYQKHLLSILVDIIECPHLIPTPSCAVQYILWYLFCYDRISNDNIYKHDFHPVLKNYNEIWLPSCTEELQ